MIFSELQKKIWKSNQLMDNLYKDTPSWSFLFSSSHGALRPLPIVLTALFQATVFSDMNGDLAVKKINARSLS